MEQQPLWQLLGYFWGNWVRGCHRTLSQGQGSSLSPPLLLRTPPQIDHTKSPPNHRIINCITHQAEAQMAPTRPKRMMEILGEFLPILPFIIDSMTTTSSNCSYFACIQLLPTGVAVLIAMECMTMAKLPFFITLQIHDCARCGGLRWTHLIRGHPPALKLVNTTIK